MKCNNCGFEHVSSVNFCVNCGEKIYQNIDGENKTSIRSTEQQYSKKNKNNKRNLFILGILLIVVIAIIIFIIFFNKKNEFEDPFEDISDLTINSTTSINDYKTINSFSKKLEDDYQNGKLSSDDYVMQLAYAIYDSDKINLEYKSYNPDFNEPNQLFKIVQDKLDELSNETLIYIFKKYALSDVKWDFPENDSTLETSNKNLYNYNAVPLINSDSNLSKLTDVKLSSNGHFLIYYTKDGKNAITDNDAENISLFLETIVDAYKSKYGLDFKYKPQYDLNSQLSIIKIFSNQGKVSSLLEKNNIDTKYMNTAMPVYIIDTDSDKTGVLGCYFPPFPWFLESIMDIYGIFDDSLGVLEDTSITTYAFPYFIVDSKLNNFDDTKIVLAHELFHHYQKYICGNGSYSECPSGNFTVETTADVAASDVVDVNKIGTAINGHAGVYITDVESSMDKVGYKYGESNIGYGAFVFATNYSNLVDNGFTKVFNSIKSANALKYLYDNSDGKYKDILLTTAEKNLTLDYSNKLLIGNYQGLQYYPSNYQDIGVNDIKQTNSIVYSSMHYYYINPANYDTKSQLSFNANSDSLTLLLFVKENNSYEYLYSHTLNKEFTIDIQDFSYYEQVAFAIVNSEINGSLSYTYEINNNGTKKPTVTAESLNLKKIDDISTFTCSKIEEDDQYTTVQQVKISFDSKDKIFNLFFKGTIQMKNYDPNNPTFSISKKIVSGLLKIMQKKYEKQFQNFKLITHDKDDKYSVTFKITKDYYKALNNSFNINGESKNDIIKSIRNNGFACEYEN